MAVSGTWWSKAPYAVWAYTSALRTADPTAKVVANVGNMPICQIYISATGASLTPSVVFNIDIYNKMTQTWVEVLDSAAITGISETMLQVGGAGSESSDLFSSLHPGPQIRIRPVHGDTDPLTYSVAVQWLRK